MHRGIDLQSEQLIAISEVPRYLPKRNGKRTHYQTVFRWVTKGSGGRFLESVRVGKRRFTSLEALHRFVEHCHPQSSRLARQESIERALRDAGL